MKMKIDFLENELTILNDTILSIEVENKKYFYRIVKNLYNILNEGFTEEIHFFENDKELNLTNILIINDYFNIDLSSKKNITELYKKIMASMDECNNQEIRNLYNKMYKTISKLLSNIDLPLTISKNYDMESLLKLMKVSIQTKDELIDKLFLLIDIEKTLNLNRKIFLINLKEYLSKEELKEFYKYAVYNSVNVILIDNRTYGPTIFNEKKLIIDDNLEEFML